MGRKVSFRALDNDLMALLSEVSSRGGVVLLDSYLTPDIYPTSIQDFLTAKPHTGWLARREDVDMLRSSYLPARQRWFIDRFGSPVIQLFSVGLQRGEIPDGFLHFETAYFEEGVKKRLPEPFLDWADGILRLVNRSFRRDPRTGIYDGPAAREYLTLRHSNGDQ